MTGFLPGAKELRRELPVFEAPYYFGGRAGPAIAAANALVPGGFVTFPKWARKNIEPVVSRGPA